EVLNPARSVVIDGAPRLVRTLLLQDHVRLLDSRLVDVERVPEQVLYLHAHVRGAHCPFPPDRLLEAQSPLLPPRVAGISRRLVNQRIGRRSAAAGRGERIGQGEIRTIASCRRRSWQVRREAGTDPERWIKCHLQGSQLRSDEVVKHSVAATERGLA